jgi:hypothetical protein
MQMRSYFVHLIVQNTTVKIKFKINIICVRLIIFKKLLCKIMYHNVRVICPLMDDVIVVN